MTPEKTNGLRDQHYNATVQSIRRCNEDLIILRVQPDDEIREHKSGQYTTLGLGQWEPRLPGCQEEEADPKNEEKLIRRAYSLSFPVLNEQGELAETDDLNFVEFYIVLVRQSDGPAPALTPRLFMLQEGDRLYLGPRITGNYVLDPVKPDDTVLFLATGTGEAPHNYMLWDLLRRDHRGSILAACCVRYRRDLGYLDLHERLAQRYDNYTYVSLTTREADSIHKKVYVQDLVLSGRLEEQLGRPLHPASTHVFLCGNPKMIGVPEIDRATGERSYPKPKGVIEILEQRGFQVDQPGLKIKGNVHYEEYW